MVTSNSTDKNRLSFSASYEVDVWGRVRSAYNAEKMRFVASRDDLQTAAMTISAKVANTWAELLGNNAEIKIVKDQIEVNESLVKLQKVRFSNSLVSSLDVLQQEEVLASSKAELPELLQKSVELKKFAFCIAWTITWKFTKIFGRCSTFHSFIYSRCWFACGIINV